MQLTARTFKTRSQGLSVNFCGRDIEHALVIPDHIVVVNLAVPSDVSIKKHFLCYFNWQNQLQLREDLRMQHKMLPQVQTVALVQNEQRTLMRSSVVIW